MTGVQTCALPISENDVYDETYMSNVNDLQQLFIDTKYAIRLLDVDNEYDLVFFSRR